MKPKKGSMTRHEWSLLISKVVMEGLVICMVSVNEGHVDMYSRLSINEEHEWHGDIHRKV